MPIANASSARLRRKLEAGSGEVVADSARGELAAVRREGNRPADAGGEELPAQTERLRGSEREHRAHRNPHDRLQGVPHEIEEGILSAKNSRTNITPQVPMIDQFGDELEGAGQRHHACAREQPQRGHRRVDVQPGGKAHGNGECRPFVRGRGA